MKTCSAFLKGICAAAVNPQSEENFAKDKKRISGLTPRCKSCLAKYREDNKDRRRAVIKAWRKRNPDKMLKYRTDSAEKNNARAKAWRKNHFLKIRYNISNEDWQKMFLDQNGCCAICNTHQSLLSQKLSVDHCHKTKKVRALLCQKCNRGIGQFNDSPELLRKTATYLESFIQ